MLDLIQASVWGACKPSTVHTLHRTGHFRLLLLFPFSHTQLNQERVTRVGHHHRARGHEAATVSHKISHYTVSLRLASFGSCEPIWAQRGNTRFLLRPLVSVQRTTRLLHCLWAFSCLHDDTYIFSPHPCARSPLALVHPGELVTCMLKLKTTSISNRIEKDLLSSSNFSKISIIRHVHYFGYQQRQMLLYSVFCRGHVCLSGFPGLILTSCM